MTQDNQLPLALVRAQMAFWTRTGELMQENRGRWLALAENAQAHDTAEAHVETLEAVGADDLSAMANWPMNTGWRLLNQGLGGAQDLTLTAINNQAAFAAGMQRAIAEWQRETSSALTLARNAMPLSGAWAELMGAAHLDPVETNPKKARR